MRFETLDLFSGRSCDEKGPTFDLRVALSAEIPVKEMPRWGHDGIHGTESTKVYIPYKFTIKNVKNQAIPVLWMVWDWEPKIKGKQKMKSKLCGWLWLCTVFFWWKLLVSCFWIWFVCLESYCFNIVKVIVVLLVDLLDCLDNHWNSSVHCIDMCVCVEIYTVYC